MKLQTGFPDASRPTASLSEALVIHRRDDKRSAETVIIFVHGLGGDRYQTWGNFPRFLFVDVKNADIGLYAYRSALSRFRFAASIELGSEAAVLADTLRDCQAYDRLVLIGHSMGGLLCKAAIKDLIDRDDPRTLTRLKGLFLLATPQAGSSWVPPFLAWMTKDMRALNPHGTLIERVHRTFLDRVSSEVGSPGRIFLPVFAVTASDDVWVSVLSSGLNIESSNRKVVRGAHTRIVKPDSTSDDVYQWVLTRVRNLCTGASAAFEANLKSAPVKIINDDRTLNVPSFSRPYDYKESEWQALLGKVAFKQYPLRTLIGYGGTGAVFRSRESSMGRDVAVKIFYAVPIELMEGLSSVTARSVRALASLSHSNIQRILDYGVFSNASSGASLFIVSEFIDGSSLDHQLSGLSAGPPRPIEGQAFLEKLLLARQVTAGLHAAHTCTFVGADGFEGHGVCHGDLVPSNILIDRYKRAVLIDFMMPDLQKLIVKEDPSRDERWSVSNGRYSFHPYPTEAYGTPGFMPPEQAAEGIVTFRSDIYTLGLTFACLFFASHHRSEYDTPFIVEWQRGWRLSIVPSAFADQHTQQLCIQIEALIESMTKPQPNDRLQTTLVVDKALSRIEKEAGMPASSTALKCDPLAGT
jgi:serine/threonine protein kinase/pimeloyl-ACP methyl ester carboxylesterase